MNKDTFEILLRITQLVASVAFIVVIPAVKRWLQETTLTKSEQRAYEIVKKAVNIAQQALWKKPGKERKEFAIKLIHELCGKAGIEISDDQISTLIESAVMEMHIAIGDYKPEAADVKAE